MNVKLIYKNWNSFFKFFQISESKHTFFFIIIFLFYYWSNIFQK